jgi:hypothetical protein
VRLKPVIALLACLAALPLAASWMPSVAFGAPEPEPVPRRWQLQIVPGDLRITSVDVPGEGARAFFYLTYTVTNNTGEDRNFAPSFELATDRGEIIRSGRDVPRYASEAIRASLKNEQVLDEIAIQGLFLQGEENAREGFVVWPANDLKADEYTIFAAGFSGETKTIQRPDNGEKVVLRKCLMLRHDAPGQLDPTSGRPLTRTSTRWILR